MDLRLLSHQTFFSAVRSGDLDGVRRVVEGPDAGVEGAVAALMAAQTDAGETALYIAVENNYEELFRYLLPLCDFETATLRSRVDLNAFHVAAKQGHAGIVKEFLRVWPALCKLCNSSNTSALYSAAVMDHLDVVNAILDVDDSVIRIVRKNGKTSLHMAARIGYHRIVKALIERDPGIVSIIDKKGQSALHMAVKGRNPDAVEELLLADISILNLRDKKGNTALHMATRKWRPQMVQLLLSYESIEINTINNQNETAMDLAEKIPYGESQMNIMESLLEAGAKHARNVGQIDETSELRRTVSDIRHDVHSQLIQNAKTNKRVTGIAKELKKLHREAVQNTINSVTVVAVLIASIAFMTIFNLPGQYYQEGPDAGKAYIAENMGFRVFCLLNATALFISLAVVVVQITLVAWETGAQKLVVSVVNKLMWTACLSTCAAFLSLAFVVVGNKASWMAITITLIGGPIMVGTLLLMSYFVLRQRFKFGEDSQRRIKRASGSKSFSWSLYSAFSDPDALSDHEKKIYAL
uniref:LOW QUALITY PROTEIN: ankyrin repeat-containing protein At2g01680 n=1 Tax=Elaeis guineensis var. tenera TaxID=51953 RepID=A0A6I9QKH3_ELAGV|nr:LOW QUALITY PROTEIN: ankyrin repeat-containing protein At2g01680 [Elaeis guineensis]